MIQKVWRIARVSFVVLLTASMADSAVAQTYYRLQNRWTSEYLHVENGPPEHGKIREGWLSAMWVVESVPETHYYRLKSRWTNQYLHVQNGPLQVGDVEPGWWSAMWALEFVPDSHYVRLQNRWTSQYLHVQNGPLQVGDVEPGWWSAMWIVSTADACPVTTVEAGPIWNQADAETKCPAVCEKADGTWNRQWKTTRQGKMSVCDCSVC